MIVMDGKEVCCDEMEEVLDNSCIWLYTDGKYYITWNVFRTKYQDYDNFEKVVKFCPFCGSEL